MKKLRSASRNRDAGLIVASWTFFGIRDLAGTRVGLHAACKGIAAGLLGTKSYEGGWQRLAWVLPSTFSCIRGCFDLLRRDRRVRF